MVRIELTDSKLRCSFSGTIALTGITDSFCMVWKAMVKEGEMQLNIWKPSTALPISLANLLLNSTAKGHDWVFSESFMQEVTFRCVELSVLLKEDVVQCYMKESDPFTLIRTKSSITIQDITLYIRWERRTIFWSVKGKMHLSNSIFNTITLTSEQDGQYIFEWDGGSSLASCLKDVLPLSHAEYIPDSIHIPNLGVKLIADKDGFSSINISLRKGKGVNWNNVFGLPCKLGDLHGYVQFHRDKVTSARLKAIFKHMLSEESVPMEMNYPTETTNMVQWRLCNTGAESRLFHTFCKYFKCDIQILDTDAKLHDLSLSIEGTEEAKMSICIEGNWKVLPIFEITLVNLEISKAEPFGTLSGTASILSKKDIAIAASVGSLTFSVPNHKCKTTFTDVIEGCLGSIPNESHSVTWFETDQVIEVHCERLYYSEDIMEACIRLEMENWPVSEGIIELSGLRAVIEMTNDVGITIQISGKLKLFGVALPSLSLTLPCENITFSCTKAKLSQDMTFGKIVTKALGVESIDCLPEAVKVLGIETAELEPARNFIKVVFNVSDFKLQTPLGDIEIRNTTFAIEGTYTKSVSMELSGSLNAFTFPEMHYIAKLTAGARSMECVIASHSSDHFTSQSILGLIGDKIGMHETAPIFPEITVTKVEIQLILKNKDLYLDLEVVLDPIKTQLTDQLQLIDGKLKVVCTVKSGETKWCGSEVSGGVLLGDYRLPTFCIPLCYHDGAGSICTRAGSIKQDKMYPRNWQLTIPMCMDTASCIQSTVPEKLTSPIDVSLLMSKLLGFKIPDLGIVIEGCKVALTWKSFFKPEYLYFCFSLKRFKLSNAIQFSDITISTEARKPKVTDQSRSIWNLIFENIPIEMTLELGKSPSLMLTCCKVELPLSEDTLWSVSIPKQGINLKITDAVAIILQVFGVDVNPINTLIPEVAVFTELALDLQWTLKKEIKVFDLEILAKISWLNILDVFKVIGICTRIQLREDSKVSLVYLVPFEIFGYKCLLKGTDLSKLKLTWSEHTRLVPNQKHTMQIRLNDALAQLLTIDDLPSFLDLETTELTYVLLEPFNKSIWVKFTVPQFKIGVDTLNIELKNTCLSIEGTYPQRLKISISGNISLFNLVPIHYTGTLDKTTGKQLDLSITACSVGNFSIGDLLTALLSVLGIPSDLKDTPVFSDVNFTNLAVEYTQIGQSKHLNVNLTIDKIKLPYTNVIRLTNVDTKIVFKNGSWSDSHITGCLEVNDQHVGQFHIPLSFKEKGTGDYRWQLSLPKDTLLNESPLPVPLKSPINLQKFADQLLQSQMHVPDIGLEITGFALDLKWKAFGIPDKIYCYIGLNKLALIPKPVSVSLENIILHLKYEKQAEVGAKDPIADAFPNSYAMFDVCVGNMHTQRLTLRKCKFTLPKRNVWTAEIPKQDVDYGLSDVVNAFAFGQLAADMKDMELPVDLRFKRMFMNLQWNNKKEIVAFDVETVARFEPTLNIFDIIHLTEFGIVGTQKEGKYDWRCFCAIDIFSIRALVEINFKKAELSLHIGTPNQLISPSEAITFGLKQLVGAFTPVNMEVDICGLSENVGQVSLNGSAAVLKLYPKRKKLLLHSEMESLEVGVIAKKKGNVEIVFMLRYNGIIKWQNIWDELSFFDSLPFMPRFSDIIVTAASKHKTDSSLRKNLTELEETTGKKLFASNFDNTKLTAPMVAVSATATMPETFPYVILDVDGKAFSATIVVSKQGVQLAVPFGGFTISGVVLKAELTLEKKFLSFNIKTTFELPTNLECTDFHPAEFGGSLKINTTSKTLSANIVFEGKTKDDPAWPTPFGLRFLTIKSVTLGLEMIYKGGIPHIKLDAAGTLFDIDIEIKLQMLGIRPRAIYFMLKNLSWSRVIGMITGNVGCDLDCLDTLLPRLNHLHLLILSLGTSMDDVDFPDRSKLSRIKGKTKSLVETQNDETHVESISVAGPCIKFDISASWFGVDVTIWGGFSIQSCVPKLEFGGKIDKPLKILGMLDLTAKDDKNTGPYLFLDIDTKALSAEFQMNVSLRFLFLTVSAKVLLDIANRLFTVDVELKLLFGLTVKGKIGFRIGRPTMIDIHAGIRDLDGAVLCNFINGVAEGARKVLEDLENKMDEAISELKKKEQESDSKVAKWFLNLCSWIVKLGRAIVHIIRKGTEMIQWVTKCINKLLNEASRKLCSIRRFDISGTTETEHVFMIQCQYDVCLVGKDIAGSFKVNLGSKGALEDVTKKTLGMQYVSDEAVAEVGKEQVEEQPTANETDSEEVKRFIKKTGDLKSAVENAENDGRVDSTNKAKHYLDKLRGIHVPSPPDATQSDNQASSNDQNKHKSEPSPDKQDTSQDGVKLPDKQNHDHDTKSHNDDPSLNKQNPTYDEEPLPNKEEERQNDEQVPAQQNTVQKREPSPHGNEGASGKQNLSDNSGPSLETPEQIQGGDDVSPNKNKQRNNEPSQERNEDQTQDGQSSENKENQRHYDEPLLDKQNTKQSDGGPFPNSEEEASDKHCPSTVYITKDVTKDDEASLNEDNQTNNDDYDELQNKQDTPQDDCDPSPYGNGVASKRSSTCQSQDNQDLNNENERHNNEPMPDTDNITSCDHSSPVQGNGSAADNHYPNNDESSPKNEDTIHDDDEASPNKENQRQEDEPSLGKQKTSPDISSQSQEQHNGEHRANPSTDMQLPGHSDEVSGRHLDNMEHQSEPIDSTNQGKCDDDQNIDDDEWNDATLPAWANGCNIENVNQGPSAIDRNTSALETDDDNMNLSILIWNDQGNTERTNTDKGLIDKIENGEYVYTDMKLGDEEITLENANDDKSSHNVEITECTYSRQSDVESQQGVDSGPKSEKYIELDGGENMEYKEEGSGEAEQDKSQYPAISSHIRIEKDETNVQDEPNFENMFHPDILSRQDSLDLTKNERSTMDSYNEEESHDLYDSQLENMKAAYYSPKLQPKTVYVKNQSGLIISGDKSGSETRIEFPHHDSEDDEYEQTVVPTFVKDNREEGSIPDGKTGASINKQLQVVVDQAQYSENSLQASNMQNVVEQPHAKFTHFEDILQSNTWNFGTKTTSSHADEMPFKGGNEKFDRGLSKPLLDTMNNGDSLNDPFPQDDQKETYHNTSTDDDLLKVGSINGSDNEVDEQPKYYDFEKQSSINHYRKNAVNKDDRMQNCNQATASQRDVIAKTIQWDSSETSVFNEYLESTLPLLQAIKSHIFNDEMQDFENVTAHRDDSYGSILIDSNILEMHGVDELLFVLIEVATNGGNSNPNNVEVVLTGNRLFTIDKEHDKKQKLPIILKAWNDMWTASSWKSILQLRGDYANIKNKGGDRMIKRCSNFKWSILITDSVKTFTESAWEEILHQHIMIIRLLKRGIEFTHLNKDNPDDLHWVSVGERVDFTMFRFNFPNERVKTKNHRYKSTCLPINDDVLLKWCSLGVDTKVTDIFGEKRKCTVSLGKEFHDDVINLPLNLEVAIQTGLTKETRSIFELMKSNMQGTIDEIITSFSAIPANVWTRYSTSSRGKSLSVKGLINWYITNGTSTDIWLQKNRGGRTRMGVGIVIALTQKTLTMRPEILCAIIACVCALERVHVSTSCVTFGDEVTVVKKGSPIWSDEDKARLLSEFTNFSCANDDFETPTSADILALNTSLNLILEDRHISQTDPCYMLVFTDDGMGSYSAGQRAAFSRYAQSRGVQCWAIGTGQVGLKVQFYGIPNYVHCPTIRGLKDALHQVFTNEEFSNPKQIQGQWEMRDGRKPFNYKQTRIDPDQELAVSVQDANKYQSALFDYVTASSGDDDKEDDEDDDKNLEDSAIAASVSTADKVILRVCCRDFEYCDDFSEDHRLGHIHSSDIPPHINYSERPPCWYWERCDIHNESEHMAKYLHLGYYGGIDLPRCRYWDKCHIKDRSDHMTKYLHPWELQESVGSVAQVGEHLTCNRDVVGSIPTRVECLFHALIHFHHERPFKKTIQETLQNFT
ncbi:unnamed protein product [Owenia fusiformis]|uniref:Uncharacterized protein n=1 Tax=Owenia fusiformis TaxID=6347 RepID=A0A8S4PQW1_OWEFU|nr:unnamed protein product [Owenia fusiformis]